MDIRRHYFVYQFTGDPNSINNKTIDLHKYDKAKWCSKEEIEQLDVAPGVKTLLREVGFLKPI